MNETISTPMVNTPGQYFASGRLELDGDGPGWVEAKDGARTFTHAVHLDGYLPRIAPDITVTVTNLDVSSDSRGGLSWSAEPGIFYSEASKGPALNRFNIVVTVRAGQMRHIGLKWTAIVFCRPGIGG